MADTLRPNQRLISNNNDKLVSKNGRFTLIMQKDGNLVLYNKRNVALWTTGTDGLDVEFCVMQADGNLVLYLEGSGRPVWSSETFGNPGSFCVMQDDGNVVIYRHDFHHPIWATGTDRVLAESVKFEAEQPTKATN